MGIGHPVAREKDPSGETKLLSLEPKDIFIENTLDVAVSQVGDLAVPRDMQAACASAGGYALWPMGHDAMEADLLGLGLRWNQ